MVVLIDKDIDILEFYIELLAGFRLRSHPFRDISAATEWILHHSGQTRFLITELSCSGRHDGLALAARLFEVTPPLPVLLVTAQVLPPHLDRRLFYGVLSKTDGLVDLPKYVRSLLYRPEA